MLILAKILKERAMHKASKIFVAGHKGLTGSAIVKNLKSKGYENLVFKSHAQLDLTHQKSVREFFEQEKPEYVFLAAAKVGGIVSNNRDRADFIYQNLMIQNNVIHQSYLSGVEKLLFLGTTCIYPKNSPQPIKEEYLLTSELEYTNEPYAIAKIAGLKMCEAYNIQYGTNFISVMPTGIYGENDSFNFENAHVLPTLVRKFHLAKLLEESKESEICKDLGVKSFDEAKVFLDKIGVSKDGVEIWGSGKSRREFMHSSDMADACVFVMENIDFKDLYKKEDKEIKNTHINIGIGEDIAISDLALLIKDIVGFKGELKFNLSRPDGTFRKLPDTHKLKSFGWQPKIEFKKGIEMMYAWYLKQADFRR